MGFPNGEIPGQSPLSTTAVVLPATFGAAFLSQHSFGQKEFPEQIAHGQGQDRINQYLLYEFHL